MSFPFIDVLVIISVDLDQKIAVQCVREMTALKPWHNINYHKGNFFGTTTKLNVKLYKKNIYFIVIQYKTSRNKHMAYLNLNIYHTHVMNYIRLLAWKSWHFKTVCQFLRLIISEVSHIVSTSEEKTFSLSSITFSYTVKALTSLAEMTSHPVHYKHEFWLKVKIYLLCTQDSMPPWVGIYLVVQ